MTKTEVTKMLAYAEYLYPSFRCDNKLAMINAWADIFANVDNEKAMAAMKRVCQTSKYFPSASEVFIQSSKAKTETITKAQADAMDRFEYLKFIQDGGEVVG